MEGLVIGGFIGIIYLVIGAVVCVTVDELSLNCFEESEMIAIFLFYPIIGIVVGVIGLINLILTDGSFAV